MINLKNIISKFLNKKLALYFEPKSLILAKIANIADKLTIPKEIQALNSTLSLDYDSFSIDLVILWRPCTTSTVSLIKNYS